MICTDMEKRYGRIGRVLPLAAKKEAPPDQ